MADCGWTVRANVAVPGMGPRAAWTVAERATWLDLHSCNSVHVCAVCASRICEHRRVELDAGVKRWQFRSGMVLLVTYTLPHVRHDRLRDLDALFMRAMSRMTASKGFKGLLKRWERKHHVYSQEVTVSDLNGWHTHRHDLWFMTPAGPISHAQAEDYARIEQLLQSEIFAHWDKACRAEGLQVRKPQHFLEHGVKVQIGYGNVADYVAKWGKEPEKKWGLAGEVTKGQTKRAYSKHYTPFGLLAAARENPQDEPKLREWFREYADVTKGKRQLVWSPGAKEDLGIGQVEDSDIVESTSELTEELHTYWAEWDAIRRVGAQARVLDAAVMDGLPGVLREIRRAVDLLPPLLRAAIVELSGGRFRYPSKVYGDAGPAPP